jgi:preprotein translocase subunit SecG
MIISGSKSLKKGQKMLKKTTNWTYTWFFYIIFGLANLKNINSYNMRKKSAMTLHDFRTYFSPLGEVVASTTL